MAIELNMHDLARKGAIAELQRLESEAATIRLAFPNLTGTRPLGSPRA